MKSYHKITPFFCIALCILTLSLILSSCSWHYRGERTDLFTVAVNNVFGTQGLIPMGEIYADPDITILETDNYGRTLFFYSEWIGPCSGYGSALVIMQASDSGYAYFYPNVCYIPYFDESDHIYGTYTSPPVAPIVMERVDPDMLDTLKEDNDWNKPLSPQKYAKAKLTSKKPKGKLNIRDHEFDKAIVIYAKNHGFQLPYDDRCDIVEYCGADSTGRELYHICYYEWYKNEDSDAARRDCEFAVIVNPDRTISQDAIIQITDPLTYFALVNKLKAQVGWK